MRSSMKYLPSVSALNSLKYLRQVLNQSLQKLPTIDVNVIIERYVQQSGKSGVTLSDDKSVSTDATVKAIGESIDEKIVALSKDPKTETSDDSKRSAEDENKVFESALNEWIESKHINVNKSQTSGLLDAKDVDAFPPMDPIGDQPIASRSGVEMRSKQLLRSMSHSDSTVNTRRRLQEFSKHLVTYPESSEYAVSQKAVKQILQLNQWSDDPVVRQHSCQVLAQLGHCEPPKGTGIRILSIDGGGTRGILVIEILRELERLSGRPIHEMFDLICGVSTGAIIGMLLGALRTPIDECEHYYHRFSSHLFKSDFFRGAGRLIWSHAYYDTAVWEKILKDIYGETRLLETRQTPGAPNVLAVSAVMNKPSLEAFVFRNYELPVHRRPLSQYDGSSAYKIWEAVRASAAAPGYFEEFRADRLVHQDGGLLINNPTAVAVHEARLLWPAEQIQCVLSVGSGRFVPHVEPQSAPPLTSLKTKIIKLIDSATDTEMVHRLMRDLLPEKSYYRINPFLTEHGTIDENRPEKLDQMKADAKKYLRKNESIVTQAVTELSHKRKVRQRLEDWLKLQYNLRV